MKKFLVGAAVTTAIVLGVIYILNRIPFTRNVVQAALS